LKKSNKELYEEIIKQIPSSFVGLSCIGGNTRFTGANCDKNTVETPLSEADKDVLKYHQEPTLDRDFKDNEVCVILKSAFDDLEELYFEDFKIVEKVSKILYVDLYTREIPYSKNGKFPLNKSEENHMFDFILEVHSKEKILDICNLLETLDMVLIAQPNYISYPVDN